MEFNLNGQLIDLEVVHDQLTGLKWLRSKLGDTRLESWPMTGDDFDLFLWSGRANGLYIEGATLYLNDKTVENRIEYL